MREYGGGMARWASDKCLLVLKGRITPRLRSCLQTERFARLPTFNFVHRIAPTCGGAGTCLLYLFGRYLPLSPASNDLAGVRIHHTGFVLHIGLRGLSGRGAIVGLICLGVWCPTWIAWYCCTGCCWLLQRS